MTEPCMFTPPHEPFYCRIHADVRLRLTDERCRRGVTLTQPQPDAGLREAAQAVVDRVDAIDPSFEAQPVPEIEALRAALRSTPAAPEFGGSLASVQPTPAAPQPECSLLLADGTICVKRAGHSDDHGMALRSTPAAHDAGSRTECSLVGVHAHSFRGPHVFHEWEPGTQPDARPTGVTHRHPPCDPDNCYIDTAVAASIRPTGDTALREAAQAHADVTHSHENHGEVIATMVDLRAALASPAPTAAPGLDWTIVCDRHRAIGFHGAVVGCLDCGRAALTPSTPDEEATR